ncbi:unnamed protein product, partial [Rotaria sp. Silwood2]
LYTDKCRLGEDKIDDNPKHVYGVYYRHPIFEKLLYTFNPIKEQSIANAPMQLLIKLPTNLQSHFHKRLPYRFELFNSNTLKCIAQQIDISPELYQSNFERSTHIKMIEDIYDQNATDFNVKVITKCGILLGYLYDCQNEPVFTWYSNQSYQFTSLVAAFDASSSYSPYIYEQKHFCEQQEAIRVLERQNLYRLTTLINEEEEIQRNNYEHDLERIWNREVSASPRFIARFRLEGGQIVNNQQFETICVICQDALQLGDHYSQWPCLAQHTFHYNCMLNALRRQNRCPLCRDAVEAGNLPPIEVAFRSLLSGIGSRATS